ncbi:MAG TPA: ABC transporter permease subunit [bacterium]|nr:ABC transporter permease subunit [bacterium]
MDRILDKIHGTLIARASASSSGTRCGTRSRRSRPSPASWSRTSSPGRSFVETITRVPGIGRYFVTATTGRDYPVLLALALLFAVIIITMNILVDLSYALLDPQVRYG